MRLALTLRQRLQLMTKAVIGGSFDVSPESVGGELLARLWPGAAGAPPRRGTQEFLEAYSTSPWLRAVESRIATAVASVQWQLFVAKRPNQAKAYRAKEIQRAPAAVRRSLIEERFEAGELEEITSHVLLDALDKGCSELNGNSVSKLTQVYLDCTGESFWLKERNSYGAPIAFWPLAPNWILWTPTMANPVYKIAIKAYQANIPSTEILCMRDPDPAMPYGRGSGIMSAAADELDTDEYAAKHTRQFFYNGAKPDFMIMPKGQDTFNPVDTARIEQDWTNKHQGFWRAFKPLFANRAVDVHEFVKDFNKLQMIELRKHERDMILQLPGMPPEMLGIIENSNRATVDMAEFIFNTQCVIPRLEFRRAELQEKLIPEYDERLIIDYVSPLQADKQAQLNAAAYAPWALTVDEWREMIGQGPLKNGEGDVHMLPVNLTPVASLSDIPPPPENLPAKPPQLIPASPDSVGAPPEPKPVQSRPSTSKDWTNSEIHFSPHIQVMTPDIHLGASNVHVSTPDIHLAPTNLHVDAPDAPPPPTVNLHVPPPTLAPIEFTVPAPQVNFSVPPAPEIPKPPRASRKRVIRDAQGRIESVVEEDARDGDDRGRRKRVIRDEQGRIEYVVEEAANYMEAST